MFLFSLNYLNLLEMNPHIETQVTSALSVLLRDTLLFPLWNENTTRTVDIAEKFNSFIHAYFL
ncbi:hypothetical protein XBI1_3010099 [Xenorhabdus bovienii str. Intermedium]|uniref:Uncharacterized protein n=1 Tax=Xenorhabdus bovienii str. Intermedium TaxID=1379677 RepID=A0A077QLV8_XENBV|nr:hypothetical protein XBI1_3010099 [Xenorhabdus bovienii str. Intermedium]